MLVLLVVVLVPRQLVVVVDGRLVRLVRQQGLVWLGVALALVHEQRGELEVLRRAPPQNVIDVVRGVIVDVGADGAPGLGAVGRRGRHKDPAPPGRRGEVGDVVARAGHGAPHGTQ
uniref:Putative secreted protein n=1 Tax=Ixodes ricinus TaxID=34613 RepID=A0A6B0UL70_IXORI